MNLRQLRVFKAVCETLSFTKAANILFMTQPAVSHVIGSLEEEIGYRLFDRLSRKIYLTQAGEVFVEKVTRILELYDDLAARSEEISARTPLRIGSTITIANVWLPKLMQEFQKKHDLSIVKVEIDSAEHTERKLRNNEIDLAFIEGVVAGSQYKKIVFSSYEMILICSPNHAWAGRKEISLEELVHEKFLLREKGSSIRSSFDSALLLHNIVVDPIWESVNSEALIQAVAHNLGVSVMPTELVKAELNSGKVIGVRIKEMNLMNQNHIVYHKDKYLSKTAIELIEMIQRKSGLSVSVKEK